MKYKGYTIKKSGFNYRVYTPSGALWQEVTANIKTAKKWVDASLIESRNKKK